MIKDAETNWNEVLHGQNKLSAVLSAEDIAEIRADFEKKFKLREKIEQ